MTRQKCAKINLRNFRNIKDIKEWTCPKCVENNIPFYNLTNVELDNLNIPPVMKNKDNLRSTYNFSNIFKSNDPNDINLIQKLINCGYYDPEEFKNLIKTLPKNSFSICHTNITNYKTY